MNQPLRTRELLDVPLSLTDYAGAMDHMDEMIATEQRSYICAVAVHSVMVAQHDTAMLAALRKATMVVPDGRPLVSALNRLGEQLDDRVYGPELMRRYCARCAHGGKSIWLYGGHDPQALETLRQSLTTAFPGIRIAGSASPPHAALDRLVSDSIAEQINRDQPDVVWVGVGVPKQEKWMAAMRERLDAPVLVGVGAAFDFLAGLKKQAPAWMQARGLEWAYRLASEPRRLGPRYLRYNPAFVFAAGKQIKRERAAGTIGPST